MLFDLEKLEEVKAVLIDTGLALADLSEQNDKYFDSIFVGMELLDDLLKDMVNPEDVEKVTKYADIIVDQMVKVDDMLGIMSKDQPGFYEYAQSVDDMSKNFSNLTKAISDKKKDKGVSQLSKRKSSKPQGPVGKYLSKELGAAYSKFGTLLNTLKVPALGAGLAGIIGILAYGVAERQRLQAEAGEVSDILVMAVDSHLNKLQKKAKAAISATQESLQKFYGISRQEYQAALSELVKGGVRTKEWLRPVSDELGLVGKNAVNMSLGFDKLLNMAGGTAARDMVENQHRYGMSVEDTTNTLMDMLTTGRTSGLGYSRYYQAVKDASEATEQLGVNIQATNDYMGKMQQHFDTLKIPKQMGSAVIVKGLKGLSSGVTNLPDDWKREIAERMGMGSGLEALIKFEETWTMLRENKGNPDALRQRIYEMMKILVDIFGTEYRTKYVLSKEFGMGPEAATLAWETYQRENEAKDNTKPEDARKDAAEASKKAFKDLRGAYESEGQKRTRWERHMNKWLKHISQIGMGLMGITATWLAKLVLFFRYIPEMFETIFKPKGAERRDQILQSIDDAVGNSDKSLALIEKGFKGLVDAGLMLMDDAFGQALKNVKTAFTTNLAFESPRSGVSPDMYRSATGDRESSRFSMGVRSALSGVSGRPNVVQAPPTVRTVYISQGGPSTADVSVPEYEEAKAQAAAQPYSPGAKAFKENWEGTEPLQIISYGVDDSGNINLALVGQCPRCGLDYDKGFDEQDYREDWNSGNLEALTRMLYSEGGAGKIYQKGGKSELAGIAYTAMNRVKQGMGKDLRDVITRGKGYGKQGAKRPYSTARGVTDKNKKEYAAVQELAKGIMAGEVQNPVGSATYFLHNTFGKGYGSESNPVALPGFADPEKSKTRNVANIGTARFYSTKGQDVADREKRDAAYKKRFEEKHTTQNRSDDYYWGESD